MALQQLQVQNHDKERYGDARQQVAGESLVPMYDADDDDEKGNFSARDAPSIRNEELSTRVGDDA